MSDDRDTLGTIREITVRVNGSLEPVSLGDAVRRALAQSRKNERRRVANHAADLLDEAGLDGDSLRNAILAMPEEANNVLEDQENTPGD